MIKAFGYIRVSTKKQLDGDGPERQRAAILAYAQANDIEIIEFFVDGVTGKSELEDRDAMVRLIVAIESNGVRTVIIERSDRLARSVMVSELILKDLREIGAKVISADGGQDITAGDESNPEAKMIRQLLAVVAEFQRSLLVLKLKLARQRKKTQTGRCEGKKPYGSYPGEPEILKRIHDLRAIPGNSYQDIADKLNDRGRLNRSGREWTKGVIAKILKRARKAEATI